MKCLGYVIVHFDQKILLLGHLLVAVLNVSLNPVCKVLPNN